MLPASIALVPVLICCMVCETSMLNDLELISTDIRVVPTLLIASIVATKVQRVMTTSCPRPIANDFSANTRASVPGLTDVSVDSRVPCVQQLFGRARLIVIHDSFTQCYGWDQLKIPSDYRRFDYRKLSPDTSVFANHSEDWPLIEKFCQTHNSVGVTT